MILHDDTDSLKDRVGAEAHVGVWEAILPIEESLVKLGHRSRRISVGAGVTDLIQKIQNWRPDLVFHLAETAFGDTIGEAHLASLLDLLKCPHTSVGAEALIFCRDKLKAKSILREHGVLTPQHATSFDGRLPETLPMPPWISKPTLEDGSIGITSDAVTSDPIKLRRRVQRLHRLFSQPILIETYIAGREFNVGVVGEQVMPLAEIDFSGLPARSPGIVGYEAKWKYSSFQFKGTATLCPAPVSDAIAQRMYRVGLAALRALNVSGYARVDIRMDAKGQIYILEVNPNPDLSPIAGMAKMANIAGWGFDGLIDRILTHSLIRRH